MGRSCRMLPDPLARALDAILTRRQTLPAQEFILPGKGEETVALRGGGALFHGHMGQELGALFVLLKYLWSRMSRPFICTAHHAQSSPRMECPMSANQSTCTLVSQGRRHTRFAARASSIHVP